MGKVGKVRGGRDVGKVGKVGEWLSGKVGGSRLYSRVEDTG